MPISFTCPHCKTQTQVADQYAGQTGPCSQCGATVTIPGAANPFTSTASSAPAVAPARSGSGAANVAVIVIAVIGVFFVCGGIMVALLLPAIQTAREAARRNSCINNVRQITLALQMYHDDHGEFPPAYTVDEQGNPLHSWRVLILPYMEMQYLYDQIDLTEPWDSPTNQMVAEQMPPEYRCPSSSSSFDHTNYMVIVGTNTAFQPGKGRKMDEFTDGTSNTILVVEAVDSSVNWMEPKDLQADQMSFYVDAGPGEISSDHTNGIVIVGFADGHVSGIDGEVDSQTLKGLTTINGGEIVNSSF